MNNLALSPLAQNHATVMETIMKPLSYARRGARWLMAAGIAVAMLTPFASHAEDAAPITPELRLDLEIRASSIRGRSESSRSSPSKAPREAATMSSTP